MQTSMQKPIKKRWNVNDEGYQGAICEQKAKSNLRWHNQDAERERLNETVPCAY